MFLASTTITSFVFIFGLFIGSFLNVAIFRLHSGESIVLGRSHCVMCKKDLSWYELIPVLSFLIQKGQCRHCASSLSWQYPLVELATATLFLWSFVLLPTLPYFPPFLHSAWSVFFLHLALSASFSLAIFYSLLFVWAICCICIVIFVYDLRYFLIPDAYILLGSTLLFIAGLLGIWHVPTVILLASSAVIPFSGYMISVIITACLSALPFFLIVFLSSGKWMGLGDVKLAFFMGMALGLYAYLAILLGVFSGAIIGMLLMAAGKAGMKTLIPFGPFLIFGTLATLFFGQAILGYVNGFLWLPWG